MPLEQKSFWIRWYSAAWPIGLSFVDLPLDWRNVVIEGIGGWREDTTVLFRAYIVFTSGGVERWIPRRSAVANEDYITLPTMVQYREAWREIPVSPYSACDVRAIRIEILNSGAGVKAAAGHARGRYVG